MAHNRLDVRARRPATPASSAPGAVEQNPDVFDFDLTDDELAQMAELDDGQRIGPDPDTFVRS